MSPRFERRELLKGLGGAALMGAAPGLLTLPGCGVSESLEAALLGFFSDPQAARAVGAEVLAARPEEDREQVLVSALAGPALSEWEALAASDVPTEVVVVDDDSPDRTWEVVAASQAADPRVRLMRRMGKSGLTSAFRDGIALSRGRFVAWMDSDMSQPPELLPALLDAARQGGVAAASRYVPGGGVEAGNTG